MRNDTFGRRLWLTALFVAVLMFITACSGPDVDAHETIAPMHADGDAEGINGYKNDAQEMRGVFIATAYNIDFPSKRELDADELAAELDSIVDTVEDANCNAIFFQVRAAADAMYDSEIFPVSEFLTGEIDGELPDGFDPFSYLINIAHKRGIEVHAWVNPLRVTRGGTPAAPKTDTEALAKTSPARLSPYLTVAYAGELYFDPGLPESRALVAAGVTELVRNYDIDGIIFDDYFYPYPETDTEGDELQFDDAETYARYGGDVELADWRRQNINTMVKMCYDAIKAVDVTCRFGVAPFGIWQNDNGENGGSATLGMEAYSAICCDALAWVAGGYVDYIAPQIYWNFSKESAPFGVLADWWSTKLDGTGVDLYVSHAAYKYGTDEWRVADAVDEITAQIDHARKLISYRGSIMYGYAEIKADTEGVFTELKKTFTTDIIYASPIENGETVRIVSHVHGEKTDADAVTLVGVSDPTATVQFNGEKICRQRDGGFTLTVELHDGKNYLEFYTKYGKYVYMIEKTVGSE